MKRAALLLLAACASGCISAGRYECHGVNVRAPIVPVGVQLGPCE